MTEQAIKPEKITKPIQLLGAWLAGLFSVDSCFLFAASNMDSGSFESISLVIASILNVPLFLLAVFLLQTKFRPELQEDSYYSTYLSQKTNEPVIIKKSEAHLMEISHKLSILENKLVAEKKLPNIEDSSLSEVLIGINKHLKNIESIKNKLSEYGVVGCSSFGSLNPPGQMSVSISESLPQSVIKKIIKISKELGFTHYNYFDNRMEETEEEVLFGGYGSADFEIV